MCVAIGCECPAPRKWSIKEKWRDWWGNDRNITSVYARKYMEKKHKFQDPIKNWRWLK